MGLNFVLIPRFGIVGAAWANGAGYAVQAALGFVFSQRFYPIAYDWPRIAKICGAAAIACVCGRLLPSVRMTSDLRSTMAHAPDVVVRGLAVVIVFVALGALSGSFSLAELRQIAQFRRPRRPAPPRLQPESVEQAGEIGAADLGERR